MTVCLLSGYITEKKKYGGQSPLISLRREFKQGFCKVPLCVFWPAYKSTENTTVAKTDNIGTLLKALCLFSHLRIQLNFWVNSENVHHSFKMFETPSHSSRRVCRTKCSPLHILAENHMDRRTWWATVHGVTKSQTRLSYWITATISRIVAGGLFSRKEWSWIQEACSADSSPFRRSPTISRCSVLSHTVFYGILTKPQAIRCNILDSAEINLKCIISFPKLMNLKLIALPFLFPGTTSLIHLLQPHQFSCFSS